MQLYTSCATLYEGVRQRVRPRAVSATVPNLQRYHQNAIIYTGTEHSTEHSNALALHFYTDSPCALPPLLTREETRASASGCGGGRGGRGGDGAGARAPAPRKEAKERPVAVTSQKAQERAGWAGAAPWPAHARAWGG